VINIYFSSHIGTLLCGLFVFVLAVIYFGRLSIYLFIYLHLFYDKPYSTQQRGKTVEQDEQG